jgi:hypothetical protein
MQKILKLVLDYARSEYVLLDDEIEIDESHQVLVGHAVLVREDPVKFFFQPQILVFSSEIYQAYQSMVENMLAVT